MIKKRIFSISASVILLLSCTGISFASDTSGFNDLPSSHWAHENVNKLVEAKIVNGYPDGTFNPNGTVTYGEFIKMAYEARTPVVPYEEIPEGKHWAYKYYNAFTYNDIFSTSDIPENLLDKPIPRKDMAFILAKIDRLSSKEGQGVGDIAEKKFSDLDTAGNRREEVKAAYLGGFIGGYPDGTFKPNGTLTRAEAATVIARFDGLVEKLQIGTYEGTPINLRDYVSGASADFPYPEKLEEFAKAEKVVMLDANTLNLRVSKMPKGDVVFIKNSGIENIVRMFAVKDGKMFLNLQNSMGLSISTKNQDFTMEILNSIDYFVGHDTGANVTVAFANPFKGGNWDIDEAVQLWWDTNKQ